MLDRSLPAPSKGNSFDAWERFLGSLREAKSIGGACREANLTRRDVTLRRESDAAFRAACDEAILDGADFLHDKAVDIATRGQQIVETVIEDDKTKRVVRTTYDGALMRFLMKGARPDIYGAPPGSGRAEAAASIGDDPDPPRSERGLDR